MNRSRENLPVTISADWLCQLYPLRSYLRVARRGSIIADVIKLGLMRFTIWQLGCGITLICLLLVNLTLLLQVQRERKSKDKAVVERSRITEAQMYILILERTEELTEKDKTEAGRLAWIMAIDTENRPIKDWGQLDYQRAHVAGGLLKHLGIDRQLYPLRSTCESHVAAQLSRTLSCYPVDQKCLQNNGRIYTTMDGTLRK